MFDKLDGILERFDEILEMLNDPSVANDQNNFRKLMKEQSDLAPIVEAYKTYKQAKQDVEDSLLILEEENDEDMRELAKEELNEAKAKVEEMEQQLKILLLPKDENDDKNVVVEIRGGAGGDELRYLLLKLYRMYCMYAEKNRWKTEMISLNENGLGCWQNSRTRTAYWSGGISLGMVSTHRLASWEFHCFSTASAAFHKVLRSAYSCGAFAGSRISLWTIPRFSG